MACIISTTFIIGTGLKKCIPTNLFGNFKTPANFVKEIDDVLLARIAFSATIFSRLVKTFFLTSKFSVTASITKSQS